MPNAHRRHPTYNWCGHLYLGEDNCRFFLLVIILTGYLTIGTFIFYFLEYQQDEQNRQGYGHFWGNFSAKYGAVIGEEDLKMLVEASSLSYLPFQTRPKVDLYQSFYLAFTACATIGFGHVVPTTPAARAVMIIYGLFGCSAVILFYNLFLERIITLLALVLRTVHEYKQRRKSLLEMRSSSSQSASTTGRHRNSTASFSSSDSLANWKPSVYWVMVCLFCLVTCIALSASVLFSRMENWDYFTSLYFSFVCFATVGFGDVVTAIHADYGAGDVIYRLVNVLIIVVGTSSLYSLFNVISIIIKHGLNFIIKQVDQKCCRHCCRHLRQAQDTYRRNAIIPGSQSMGSQSMAAINSSRSASNGGGRLNTAEARQYSDEMEMDVREFLQANKVSLAVMQKDLYESANQRGRTTVMAPSWHHSRHYTASHHDRHASSRHSHDVDEDFTPANIGPMAIVQHTLEDED